MDTVFGNVIQYQRRQLNTCGQSKTGWKIPVILIGCVPLSSMPLMLGTQREQQRPQGHLPACPVVRWVTRAHDAPPQAQVWKVWPGAVPGSSATPTLAPTYLLIRKAILFLSKIWFDIYIHKHIYQHLYLYSDSTKLEILLPRSVTSWSASFG